MLDYPSLEQERSIIADHGARVGQMDPVALGVGVVADAAAITDISEAVGAVRLTEDVVTYIADLVRATRESADIDIGASPRAGAMLAGAARAHAALDGRDYVIPDDVKVLAVPALRHRLVLSPAAEIEGRRVEQVLDGLVNQVAAPR